MKRPSNKKSKATSASKGKPYPYPIPPVNSPDPTVVKDLNPWYIFEFFRIEALLRSEIVMNLYRKTFKSWNKNDHKTDIFMATYKVVGGWQVLDGVHARFFLHQDHPELLEMRSMRDELDFEPRERWPAPGIVNLGNIIEHDYDHFKVNILEAFKHPQEHGLARKPRAILLALDPARSPSSLIKGLRSILKKEHQIYKNIKGRIQDPLLDAPWPWPTNWEPYRDPRRLPPIFGFKGIKTWLEYFKCYDLRHCQGLSFGQIAQQVYGTRTTQTYERAEQGYKRVKRLIAAAELNDWPPPKP